MGGVGDSRQKGPSVACDNREVTSGSRTLRGAFWASLWVEGGRFLVSSGGQEPRDRPLDGDLPRGVCDQPPS